MIQRGRTAKIGGGGIDRGAAVLKGKAADVVGEKGKDIRREVQHHEMSCVLLSHQPAGEEGEAGLHE